MVAAAGLLVTLLAAPVAEWIGRAPEIGASLKQKLYVFDRPLAALRELQNALMPVRRRHAVAVEQSQIELVTPVIAFVTPAMVEIVVFFGTLLFFLAGQMEFRRYLASLFSNREAKLRFLRIVNEIEEQSCLLCRGDDGDQFRLGTDRRRRAPGFRLAKPVIFGVLAVVLNYLPYIGPACMAIVLLGVGLVTFPSLGQALLLAGQLRRADHARRPVHHPDAARPPADAQSVGDLSRDRILGLAVGADGRFLAVPLSVVGLVIFNHLFPSDDPKLPG